MIQFDSISFRYENSPDLALRNISLSIPKGQFLAIVGHNGSGKSTLARHINGLLLPGEGHVYVNGLDTSNEDSLLEIRRHVGIVFQNPDNQLVTTIVEEDVAFGPENLGLSEIEIRSRVDEALRSVGMTDFALSAAHKLSGGQKQRIAIAGMLAMRPDVLILDEATAMLDPVGRQSLIDTVSKLNREQGMTVIMITQYMEEIVHADRVIVMHHGEIAMDDTPTAIFSQAEALRNMSLDVPVAVQLRDALCGSGIKLSADILTIEQLSEALCQLL